jgi:penicillin-binding protein 1A
MFFRRSKPQPELTDLDSRLAAFDQAYASAYPGDPQPWATPTFPSATEPSVPKKRLFGKSRWWWISRIFAAFLLMLMIIVLWLAFTAPLSKSLQPIAPPRITLLAWDGTPIARNGAVVDKPVKIKDLPPHLTQAFLSIEDRRFYSHWGVDPRSIGRALWSNTFGDGITQGGSTITQQLAKFTFLTPERSMTRKAREALIAFWLEGWLTKDEILERYLSNAYFGDNVYGIRAASLHYFYRQPERLTLSQSIMLAGLVQAPNRLAPTRNPARAAKRAKMVMNAMVATGALTEKQADATPIAKVDVRYKETLPTGTYFADWAMPQARQEAELSYADQTIRTTLDSRLQNIARNVVGRAPLGKAQVALVAMRPNGEVVAMIGGRNYKDSPFNRATQAKRQPGSTFKLVVYLAALRSGMSPDSIVDDSPITEGLYRPKNYGDSYRGKITLGQAFAQSSNVVTVRLYNQLGYNAIARTAKELGIESPLSRDPSMALGSSGMTLMELTAAYAAVAADKWPITPRAFIAEDESWFDWLVSGQRSFDSRSHDALMKMLSGVINGGTGRAARLSVPAYGKTGTSQDYRDALFIGFAGDLVVGVWIGNDDNTPLKGITGGGLPARIWRDFMGQAVKGAGPKAKPKPVIAPNPDGPVEPLDLPDIPELPIGTPDIRVDPDKGVTVSGEIEGVPLDLTIDKNGVDLKTRDKQSDGRR